MPLNRPSNLRQLVHFNLRAAVLTLFFVSCYPSSEESDLSGTIFTDDKESVSIQFTDPIVFENFLESYKQTGELPETRIPYLVYYAVDSEQEPYMKAAVDYEINQLKLICTEGATHVNWMILRNSKVVKDKTYEICRAGHYKEKTLAHYLEVSRKRLNQSKEENGLYQCSKKGQEFVSNLYLCGDWQEASWPHGMYTLPEFLQTAFDSVFPELATDFSNVKKVNLFDVYENEYPLAESEFLNGVLADSTAILHPFHQNLYVPMIHIKSHGHFDFAVTGLSHEQMKQKILRQKLAINQTVQNDETPDPNILEEKGLTTNVYNFHKLLSEEFVNLSNDAKVKTLMEMQDEIVIPNLGVESTKKVMDDYLNQQCGLGEEVSKEGLNGNQSTISINGADVIKKHGLGAHELVVSEALSANDDLGLGAHGVYFGNQIGTSPDILAELLEDSYIGTYLFVMLEACDTNLSGGRWDSWGKKEFVDGLTDGPGVKAVYSAKASLWYRNVDWHLLFASLGNVPNGKTHAMVMQHLMIQLSKKMINIHTSEADKYKEDYLKIVKYLNDIGVH